MADKVASGRAVLAEAVNAYRETFGERLLAAYALGSLAHGGFAPLVSDVDLGVVLDDPLVDSDPQKVQEVAEGVKAVGSTLHRRLSVFWGTPSTLRAEQTGGRFPPLDLLDLIEHGVLLAGEDVRHGLARPSRTDLLMVGAEFSSPSWPASRPPGDCPIRRWVPCDRRRATPSSSSAGPRSSWPGGSAMSPSWCSSRCGSSTPPNGSRRHQRSRSPALRDRHASAAGRRARRRRSPGAPRPRPTGQQRPFCKPR